jgi:hypothetical protein
MDGPVARLSGLIDRRRQVPPGFAQRSLIQSMTGAIWTSVSAETPLPAATRGLIPVAQSLGRLCGRCSGPGRAQRACGSDVAIKASISLTCCRRSRIRYLYK